MSRQRRKSNKKNINPVVPVNDTPVNNRIMMGSFSRETHFSGPLPPPDIMAAYNDIIPNGAERLLAMTEKQQEHRMGLENFVVHHDGELAKRGQTLGFVLALVLITGGIVAVIFGKDVSGLLIIGGSFASLVGIFIQASIYRNKRLQAQSKTLTEKAAEK